MSAGRQTTCLGSDGSHDGGSPASRPRVDPPSASGNQVGGGEPVGAAEITRLIHDAGAGDPRAAAELLPLVYAQLRALADRRMRRENPGQTLQATALVHEAYLRIVEEAAGAGAGKAWAGRWQFFAAAAEAMRRILVEAARRRASLKRGGEHRRLSLDAAADVTVDEPPDDLLALDEALAELARLHPEQAELVKLRYFAGLTTEQAAEAMGMSVRTAGRVWAYARAWLYAKISG